MSCSIEFEGGNTGMNVDPNQLRALATSMDDIGDKVDALDVRSKGEAVAGGIAWVLAGRGLRYGERVCGGRVVADDKMV
ncbi:hypothetical protein [Nocardia mangyaensis]|uniref:hypothetical protein n=1 Tax=Nocardia mangyaensis TaxID=2213200 RepID=UPI00267620AB|nr:hypothetical protein [Nocardia mangyaensis]MDO3647421.1 hypothetical protein [Nocardia mangyaensis]